MKRPDFSRTVTGYAFLDKILSRIINPYYAWRMRRAEQQIEEMTGYTVREAVEAAVGLKNPGFDDGDGLNPWASADIIPVDEPFEDPSWYLTIPEINPIAWEEEQNRPPDRRP